MSGIDGVFRSLDVSSSALSAQRFRMEIVAENIAKAEVDSVSGGGQPYRRKRVAFETMLDRASRRFGASSDPLTGVRATARRDHTPGDQVRAPKWMEDLTGVDADGNYEKSNVEIHGEMIELMQASRAYEANIAAVKAFREMVQRALSIGR